MAMPPASRTITTPAAKSQIFAGPVIEYWATPRATSICSYTALPVVRGSPISFKYSLLSL
jgi:hypothetical protein